MKYKIKFTSLFCVLNPSFFPVDVITTHCEPRKGAPVPVRVWQSAVIHFYNPFLYNKSIKADRHVAL